MSFLGVLRSEWTKLRSVNRWMLTLAAAGVVTVSFGLLAASGGTTDRAPGVAVGPSGKPVADDFHFTHRTLSGDGTIVARVASQEDSHARAAAGLMVKDGIRRGSTYAAVMVTPGAGVRMSADFADVASRPGSAPRWLRLTRAGARVTAYDSTDGVEWRELGAVSLPRLPATASVGMFVNSPEEIVLERSAGMTSVGGRGTTGEATFEGVRVDGAASGDWASDDLFPEGLNAKGVPLGGTTRSGDSFTLVGTGDIGLNEPPDDTVQIGLFGTLAGLMMLVPLGVVFITAEYRRGMIRTTFAASPARVPVLVAKAVVLGAVTFVVGLVAAVVSFFVTQPVLRDHGFAPPWFPAASLSEPRVLRAVVGAAVFLTLLTLVGLGVGTILRRSAAAIALVITLTVVPTFLGWVVPTETARWLMLLTPAGGLALQRAKPPTDTLVDPAAMIGPWAGLLAVGGYAVVALGVGAWLLRRRDV